MADEGRADDELREEVERLREIVATLRRREERFRALAESSPDWLWEVDCSGVYTYCGPQVRDLLGYEPEELIGKTAFELMPPEEASRVEPAFREAAAEGVDLSRTENVVLRRDGRRVVLETSGTPIRGSNGDVVGYRGVDRDVSDRVSARDAVRRSEHEKRLILDSVDEVVIFTDPEMRILWPNRAACDSVGRLREDLIGKRCHEFWDARDEPCVDCVVIAAMRSKCEQRLERTTPDGRIWFNRGYPVFAPDGTVAGGIEVCLDITERRRAEEEIRRIEQRMQEAQKLQSLGVLAGGIAHDFNNILTAVLGNAELAETKLGPDSSARRHLVNIEDAARRAAGLCQQMLAYAGKGRLAVGPIDLSEVVRDMLEILQAAVAKTVRLELPPVSGLPLIEGDAALIRQVVLNLVTNASEAIGDEPGVVTISVGGVRVDPPAGDEKPLEEELVEGTYAYLEVADTGGGMTPDVRARMFEPFFTTRFTGRGLGMSAVQGIVRGHGGVIRVRTEPGRGTTVRVLLPTACGQAPAQTEGSPVDATWRGAGTVLVVDDEESVRSVARGMLEALGLRVLAVSDGRSAVAVFRARWREISAVLLDVSMPVLGGEATLREILSIDPDARIVMSSGYDEQDVGEGLAGSAGFLQKPYRLEALRETFRRMLPERPGPEP